jgi:hypothetical protein
VRWIGKAPTSRKTSELCVDQRFEDFDLVEVTMAIALSCNNRHSKVKVLGSFPEDR